MNILEQISGLKKKVPCKSCGDSSTDTPQEVLPNRVLISNSMGESKWLQVHFTKNSSDFINAVDLPLPAETVGFGLSVNYVNGSQFIYRKDGQWDYLEGGGIRILMEEFDATLDSHTFEITLKEKDENKD